MAGFKKLKVWKRGKELAVDIYKTTQERPFSRDFGFRDQIRRAAVSIPSNIAEGDERGSNKDAIGFFYIAKGSLAELHTQLEIAHEIEYISGEKTQKLSDECVRIGKMLGSLIKART